jgi:hypothetical protein
MPLCCAGSVLAWKSDLMADDGAGLPSTQHEVLWQNIHASSTSSLKIHLFQTNWSEDLPAAFQQMLQLQF